MRDSIYCGDCLQLLLADSSIDMVFTSPPYEDARTYGLGYNLRGLAWVEWCIPRFLECLRVCRGSVFWVVEGRTRRFEYSLTPQRLMVALADIGVTLRKPPIYKRYGIPGSGGPDGLRNDYEQIIWATKGGRLPWYDNTAMGHPPKCKVGGPMSNRTRRGDRVQTRRKPNGGKYKEPKLANPGNIIDCGAVGGGNIGNKLAHENEAPFPEQLVEFFVRSFCPPGGIVLDPFCGSGTTLAVAKRLNRQYFGADIRRSQVELSERRLTD